MRQDKERAVYLLSGIIKGTAIYVAAALAVLLFMLFTRDLSSFGGNSLFFLGFGAIYLLLMFPSAYAGGYRIAVEMGSTRRRAYKDVQILKLLYPGSVIFLSFLVFLLEDHSRVAPMDFLCLSFLVFAMAGAGDLVGIWNFEERRIGKVLHIVFLMLAGMIFGIAVSYAAVTDDSFLIFREVFFRNPWPWAGAAFLLYGAGTLVSWRRIRKEIGGERYEESV